MAFEDNDEISALQDYVVKHPEIEITAEHIEDMNTNGRTLLYWFAAIDWQAGVNSLLLKNAVKDENAAQSARDWHNLAEYHFGMAYYQHTEYRKKDRSQTSIIDVQTALIDYEISLDCRIKALAAKTAEQANDDTKDKNLAFYQKRLAVQYHVCAFVHNELGQKYGDEQQYEKSVETTRKSLARMDSAFQNAHNMQEQDIQLLVRLQEGRQTILIGLVNACALLAELYSDEQEKIAEVTSLYKEILTYGNEFCTQFKNNKQSNALVLMREITYVQRQMGVATFALSKIDSATPERISWLEKNSSHYIGAIKTISTYYKQDENFAISHDIDFFAKSIRTISDVTDKKDLADLLCNLAFTYFSWGSIYSEEINNDHKTIENCKKSESYCLKAIVTFDQLKERGHENILKVKKLLTNCRFILSTAMNTLGVSYIKIHKLDEAVELFEKSVKYYQLTFINKQGPRLKEYMANLLNARKALHNEREKKRLTAINEKKLAKAARKLAREIQPAVESGANKNQQLLVAENKEKKQQQVVDAKQMADEELKKAEVLKSKQAALELKAREMAEALQAQKSALAAEKMQAKDIALNYLAKQVSISALDRQKIIELVNAAASDSCLKECGFNLNYQKTDIEKVIHLTFMLLTVCKSAVKDPALRSGNGNIPPIRFFHQALRMIFADCCEFKPKKEDASLTDFLFFCQRVTTNNVITWLMMSDLQQLNIIKKKYLGMATKSSDGEAPMARAASSSQYRK